MGRPPRDDLATTVPPTPPSGGPGTIDFAAVVSAHESDLLRYVTQLLRCPRDQAEDIVQDTFLRLHRQVVRHGAESVRDVGAFLFRVAHNLGTDMVRKAIRRRKVRRKLAARARTEDDQVSADSLGELEHREARRQAMDELQRLPDDLKQVVLLKIIQGMTLRQIGEVTGLSVGNAAYRLNKAMAELTRRLKKTGVV